MTILFYDCFSGISGDMNLGAMIDLGVSETYLREQLSKLNLHGWELIVEKDQRHNIFGTKVTVKQTHHEHIHRHLSHIIDIIEKSDLSDADKDLSIKIFTRIAKAEAKIHNTNIEKVHFHEIGAIDSIIDIVGAAICYNALNIKKVYSSTIELGGGFVKCAHGTLPVPAPATTELVKGLPISTNGVDFEATTPTGAAIIATLTSEYYKYPNMTIKKQGYGIGQKENPLKPNILRAIVAETLEPDLTEQTNSAESKESILIQCNIDDMNPEFYEYIIDKLFAKGADDVYLIPIIMKHSRPANILNILCSSEKCEDIKQIVFQETNTIGLRVFPFTKDFLERNYINIDTKWGTVALKNSYYNNKVVNRKLEYSDCRAIAEKYNIPLKEVYNTIQLYLAHNE